MSTSNSALRFIAAAIWCLCIGAVVSCAQKVSTHKMRTATSVSEAEGALNEAENELGELFDMTRNEFAQEVSSGADSDVPADQRPSTAVLPSEPQSMAPPAAPGPSADPQRASDDDTAEELARCRRACAALESIERAGARVCELGGDDSDSCARARHRVRAARLWVWRRCPICALDS